MSRQNTLFIGNIPFEFGEDALRELVSGIGGMLDLRVITDRDTGRPKGYAFAQFGTQAQVEAAIRNLDGYEVHGRKLRVNLADGGASKSSSGGGGGSGGSGGGGSGAGGRGAKVANSEDIDQAVKSLAITEQWHLMAQMQRMVKEKPEEARAMLAHNPVLSQALLQMQLNLEMVKNPLPSMGGASAMQQGRPMQQPGGMQQPGHAYSAYGGHVPGQPGQQLGQQPMQAQAQVRYSPPIPPNPKSRAITTLISNTVELSSPILITSLVPDRTCRNSTPTRALSLRSVSRCRRRSSRRSHQRSGSRFWS